MTLLFLFSYINFANAFDFRHKYVTKKKAGYLYVTVGINIPLQNNIKDASKVFSSVPVEELRRLLNNQGSLDVNFSSNRIGGTAGIGYKAPYFFRLEGRFDFTTFSRERKADGQYQGRSYNKLAFTVRQLGFMGNIFIDIDNNTNITPYIGVGGGGFFVQGIIYADNINTTTTNIQSFIIGNETTLLRNFHFAYEMNAGIRFGDKKFAFSIEGFHRKIPSIDLKTTGAILKLSFQI